MADREQLLVQEAVANHWLTIHNGGLALAAEAPPATREFLIKEGLEEATQLIPVPPNPVTMTDPPDIDWQAIRAQIARREILRIHALNHGRLGPLGLPVSGFLADGTGFIQHFQGGNIKVLDHGRLEANQTIETTVRFRGLHCFGEQRGAGADEPYVVVGVYPPHKREKVQVTKFPAGGAYGGVNSRSQKTEIADVFSREPPTDLVVHAVLMEHDHGNEASVRNEIKAAIDKGVDTVEAAIDVGLPEDWQNLFSLGLASLITKAFGLGDDVIGTHSFGFNFAELQGLAWHPLPLRTFGGIQYTHETPLLTDGDASYKLYFEIFSRIVTQQLRTS